jgi:hypothetical protein
MSRLPDMGALDFRARARDAVPGRPIVFLTYDALDNALHERLREHGELDRIFYWFRDANVLTSIVKSVEDHRNAPSDTRAGVQVILLVEDSPRYYSLLLPHLYTEILSQTRRLICDGVNDFHRLLRMRARPKILLAETLRRARAIVRQYGPNLIGVLSDVHFPAGGALDARAGFVLADEIRAQIPDVPVLLHSSEPRHRTAALGRGFDFLDKDSPELAAGLRSFLVRNCGFGDFVFRTREGREVGRAANLYELRDAVAQVPEESLLYHAGRNHFSTWLRARTEFALAEELRPKRVSDFADTAALRREILDALERLTDSTRDGEVRDFVPDRLRPEANFTKLGTGSLGGKARGLAYMNGLLARDLVGERHPGMRVVIPNTFVLCSDIFDRFLDANELRQWALSAGDDGAITRRFREAPLPEDVKHDLRALLAHAGYPLAVRSSSLLEDNQTLPFAGLYATFMLPNAHTDLEVRLQHLCQAIKQVYASMFHRGPREYLRNTGYRLDEERMSVIIQEVAGRTHGRLHYPTFSGVARSYNFYPFADLKPEEGTASLALGLGKTIVESGRVFHFCPAHPHANPPWGSDEEYLTNTQTRFFALDLTDPGRALTCDESWSLVQLELDQAEGDGELRHIASTWSPQDGTIRDFLTQGDPRIVRFAQILKHGTLPLPALLQDLLAAGQESFGTSVEIEFAVDVDPTDPSRATFHFLQIRPMVVSAPNEPLDLGGLSRAQALCASTQTLGNGRIDDLYDLVYLDPRAFDTLHTRAMAMELATLNSRFVERERGYVLLGFGRWATSDPLLGVPVGFADVSQARVFIEADRDGLWVEPSQGSHFFQNMLALRLGYLFVKEGREGSFVDWDWLQAQEPVERTRFVRHLRFDQPLVVDLDGHRSQGVVYRPGLAPSRGA